MKVYTLKAGAIIIGYLVIAGLMPGILKVLEVFNDETIFKITGILLGLWALWMISVFIRSLTSKSIKYAKYES